MLGSAVVPAFVDAGHEVTATDLHPREVRGIPMAVLDVRDAAAVSAAVQTGRPEIVLHLAAETDLEVCESSRDHAYGTNTIGTHNVAIACNKGDASLVYISTAGVFDGEKQDGPYTEFDEARPINVYGRSKFLGEDYVMRLVPRSFVVRPAGSSAEPIETTSSWPRS